MPAGRLRTRGQAILAIHVDAKGKERSAGSSPWADHEPPGSRGTGQRQGEELGHAIKQAEVARGVAVDVDGGEARPMGDCPNQVPEQVKRTRSTKRMRTPLKGSGRVRCRALAAC
jgi:hypothetical protein